MPNRNPIGPDDISPARDYDATGAEGTRENAAVATGGANAGGTKRASRSRTTTAKRAAPKKAAAKKSAAQGGGTKKAAAKTGGTATKKSAAKKSAGTKSAVKSAAGKGGARKSAGAKSAAQKSGGTKSAARKSGTKARTTRAQANGRVRPLPAGKMAADYGEAKRALGTLWQDVTKQTYSTFNSIAGRVEKNFNEARQSINEMDVRYALERTQNKLKSVAKSGQHSVQLMGRQARLLYQMLKDAVGGRFKVPWATVSAATAALLYFVSPLDILPDFIPGAGLIDDALVISMAISLARMDLRRYAQENELNASEYGL